MRDVVMKRSLIISLGLFLLLAVCSHAEEPSANPQVLDMERDYIVKEGDTLWDISQRFYGDPFLWPRLWQQNQYVTNPHQIYPGDRIRLYPYKVLIKLEELEKPPPVEEVMPPSLPPVEEVPPPLPPPPERVRLVIYPEVRSAGFVAEEMEGIGRIVAAKVDKLQLVADDEIYVHFQKGISVRKGDQFTIFRVGEPIIHPIIKKKVLGNQVMILGTAVIIKTAEHGAQTALITRSYDSIVRGDELTPYFAPSEELAVDTVEERLYGWIVASKRPKIELVEGDVVYIDRGEVNHIRPGYLFHVLRRGAVVEYPVGANKKKKKKETVKLPDELVARLVVLRTQQKTSTAVIVQTRLPVRVGDEITTVTD
jgi:hypothetical protein